MLTSVRTVRLKLWAIVFVTVFQKLPREEKTESTESFYYHLLLLGTNVGGLP